MTLQFAMPTLKWLFNRRGSILFLVALCLGTVVTIAQTAVTPAGSGTSGDPYQITQLGNLVWMGSNVASSSGKYYRLMNDVDASSTTNWNDSSTTTNVLEGFNPIGTFTSYASQQPFSGSLDGNNHVISNLTINRPGVTYIGLFGNIGPAGIIKNLKLNSVNVIGGGRVGSLAGFIFGTVTNCQASGFVGGGELDRVGGLVGQNWTNGIIWNCSSSCIVSGTSNYIGGLVGVSHSIIIGSYATGSTTGNLVVGGLVGVDDDGTTNCFATGNVTSTATEDSMAPGLIGAGGLIGAFYATNLLSGKTAFGLSECYAKGSVQSKTRYVGGLAGFNEGKVIGCHAEGNVNANTVILTNGSYAGGLVGENTGSITNCYAIGNIVAQSSYLGGLVGYNFNFIAGSHAEGNVTGNSVSVTKGTCAGGLVGYNYNYSSYYNGNISNCYAIGAVQGQDAFVGGLIGRNVDGNISGCQAGGDVVCYGNNLTNGSTVGGLVGSNEGPIGNCSAAGAVQGLGFNVGGLVGQNWAPLVACQAIGNVTGNAANASYGSYAGGLVGLNNSLITNCSAMGTVYGLTDIVGGLVGLNRSPGAITGCQAAGEVLAVGDALYGSRVGGLVGAGYTNSTIINSSASGNVTGQNYAVGGLIGVNEGLLSGCSATGNAINNGNDTYYGARVGGLAGNNTGSISNCYAKGNVQGQTGFTGGLVGFNYTDITSCYSAGLVTGYTNVGGLAGGSSVTVTASFWDTQTSGQSNSPGSIVGSGKTTAQMKQQATFSGWDFVNVWGITETQTYPFFKVTPSQPSYAFAPLITTTNPLPLRATGQPFTQTLSARGGTTPFIWTLASGSLPPGLSLNTNGVISGTPSVMTNVNFIMQVAGSNGLVSVKTFSLSTVTPGSLSGQSYAAGGFQLTVTGASGSQYAVQVSTNLIDWTALQTNFSPFVFTDTNSRSYTRRFYRTVYLP